MARNRDSSSFWFQALMRVVAVALLFVCLGFLIHCQTQFPESYGVGYAIAAILLAFNLGLLIRFGLIALGKAPVPRHGEVAWIAFSDLIGVVAAILGGVLLVYLYGKVVHECPRTGRGPEHDQKLCEEMGYDPAGGARLIASGMLYAVGGVMGLATVEDCARCCSSRR
ncbi:hypothetical protein B0T14DRAFT_283665 [Immersiella caudata]|uniref:MARVEL domain-containing protein n=1 Tax=Immersiella caudata TaxID=314043 RepID=A0AA39WE35_9PEZI|nr:hypothetical protein B0T14DRAFT_283665 [Immersiella caudata]